MAAAVGGSPIEYWLPPRKRDSVNVNACESDVPQCDNQYNDTSFYTDIIEQLVPYTLGAIVWDQAERDVKCPHSLAAYSCMQQYLLSSWRTAFRSPGVPFVAVQLPGYTAALINGTGHYEGSVTPEMIWKMRLQQADGAVASANASAVATYDMSCASTSSCPYGSIHNVEKAPIGARIGAQLHQHITGSAEIVEGPHAKSAVARTLGGAREGTYVVTVKFDGGSLPYTLGGTKNCTTCCNGIHTLDLDASSDGITWVNSTNTILKADAVTFHVHGLTRPPTVVRHTASAIFPQCALYNKEGLPALPFLLDVPSEEA